MTATMGYNRELTLEELESICGGVSQTEDNAIVEAALVTAMTFAAKLIIKTVLPDTFEEFYSIIKSHPALVQSGIAASTGIPGIIAYNLLSDSTKCKLWRNVYDALK